MHSRERLASRAIHVKETPKTNCCALMDGRRFSWETNLESDRENSLSLLKTYTQLRFQPCERFPRERQAGGYHQSTAIPIPS